MVALAAARLSNPPAKRAKADDVEDRPVPPLAADGVARNSARLGLTRGGPHRIFGRRYGQRSGGRDPGRGWGRDHRRRIGLPDRLRLPQPQRSKVFCLFGFYRQRLYAIRRLFRDYDDKRSEIFASAVVYNIDRDKIAALEKAQHDAIARVLTPQELENFDLRNSNTARQLRYDLGAFNPTEAEFRTLFRLRQPFDEQFSNSFSGVMPPSQEAMRQRSDAQRLLNEQIKAALGPERGAEYQRTTDYNYRQTSLIVARLELPPETTNSVFAVQQDLQQRARDTMMNRSLAPDARTQQLAELQQEATAKLTPLLGGASGFEAYKQYGGSWMQMLQPRPPPTPRP
jgi:hypothetical protein